MSKVTQRVTENTRIYHLWENDDRYQKPYYKNSKYHKIKETVKHIMWQSFLTYRSLEKENEKNI